MKKIDQLLVILSILSIAASQALNLSQIYTPKTLQTMGPEYNDPAFIKLIDNYFGCKTWTNGICTECSASYYFNNNGVCCLIDQYCLNFNRQIGICEVCYDGYNVLANGSCSVTSRASNECQQWSNNKCIKCSVRYYFNNQNQCVPVSNQCRTWTNNGLCDSCYHGYVVANGSCIQDPNPQIVQSVTQNPLCKTWKDDKICLQCAQRAYFDSNGICLQVSNNCNTWDRLDGLCVSCYKGYETVNGSCVLSDVKPIDPGCSAWNASVCIKCSQNWAFNKNNVCIQVSDSCKTSDALGSCTSCYQGYDVQNGSCVLAPRLEPTDAGCNKWEGTVCKSCAPYWTFNSLGVCIPISSLCKTYEGNACTSCYKGYDLTNGECLYSIHNNDLPKDGGCKKWDFINAKCVECSLYWVFNTDGLCVPVNDQCRTYDDKGACTNCYKGYEINNGSCIKSTSPSIDLGCKIIDWATLKCTKCSNRFFLSSSGVCSPIDTQCRAYNQDNGNCLTCYKGYDLINGTCVLGSSPIPSDPGCKSWNGTTCLECSPYWTFNSENHCVLVSTLCKTYQGLACTSCFTGYDLVNGSCIFSAPHRPTDAGCAKWNWKDGICLECSNNWYFTDGICTPVDALCNTYDRQSGKCLSCYKGYNLVNGSCILSTLNQPKDVGCGEWNWDSQICINCSYGWFMNNGTCKQVSPYCKTFNSSDNSGNCLSCYSGYSLSNGVCSQTQTVCQTSNDTACLSCYSGYALYKGKCIPLSNLADIALYYAECCPQKLVDLRAQGRIPK